MARPKSVTIKLTTKQRQQIRNLTGFDHSEVMFERVTGRTSKVAAKASLARKTPLAGRLSGSGGPGGFGFIQN
jgi:hypothetical protein